MHATTNDPPSLRCDLNGGTLDSLPPSSSAPRGDEPTVLAAIKAAGFGGVQGFSPAACKAANLPRTSSGRVDNPGDTDPQVARWLDEGAQAATLHVGSGLEDDPTIDRLLEDILNTSARRNFPLYVETHRATITQDIFRTVQLTRRFPQIRFNADFSHWYTGLEMVYGNFEAKLQFIQPVFDRVRFIHGRIGNPGSIQVDVGDGTSHPSRPFLDHFKTLWTRSFAGFLRSAVPGDFIPFTVELLKPQIYYALTNQNGEELTDRWQQALTLTQIAKSCFTSAQSQTQ